MRCWLRSVGRRGCHHGRRAYDRLYELWAGSDESAQHVYATIAEAHHPQHIAIQNGMAILDGTIEATWSHDAERMDRLSPPEVTATR